MVKTYPDHKGYEIERTWGWKDEALDKKWWYYGKLIRDKATLISPGTELSGVPQMRQNPKPSAKPRKFGYSSAGVVEAVVLECVEVVGLHRSIAPVRRE